MSFYFFIHNKNLLASERSKVFHQPYWRLISTQLASRDNLFTRIITQHSCLILLLSDLLAANRDSIRLTSFNMTFFIFLYF